MKTQKVYVTDVIEDSYKTWKHRVVILKAPTGAGKTTFILNKFIPYFKENDPMYGKKKVLVLANRKLLQRQYENSILDEHNSYREAIESCDVKTYQEMAEKIKYSSDTSWLFKDYSAVVCDEAHYFYADSDFAPEAFKVLYALLYGNFGKTIVFISATIDEVQPIIIKAWETVYDIYRTSMYADNWNVNIPKEINFKNSKAKREVIILNNLIAEDYSRYKVYVANNYEELARFFAESEFKSIVFIDDKKKADEMREMLIREDGLKGRVSIIHADNINARRMETVVNEMVKSRKLEPKVLITTSVLDNGVSLEDSELRNISIITSSKLSFIQMLGRIRECSEVETINLILLKKDATEISPYITCLENLLKYINWIMRNNKGICGLDYNIIIDDFYEIWMNPDGMKSQAMRKVLIPCTGLPAYFSSRVFYPYYYPINPGMSLVVNLAAVSKIENAYMELRALSNAASLGGESYIRHMLTWIGKEKETIHHLHLISEEEKKAPIREKLLLIKDFTKREYQQIRKELVPKLKKLYPDLKFRGGNALPGTENMRYIYADLGLALTQVKVDGTERYTVNESRKESCYNGRN